MKKKELLKEIESLEKKLEISNNEKNAFIQKIKDDKLQLVIETMKQLGQVEHNIEFNTSDHPFGCRNIIKHEFTLVIQKL